MAHYCKTCRSSLETIIQKAIEFFGPNGMGMPVKEDLKTEDGHCICFKSDSGHIFMKASSRANESEVEVENYECDQQVKQFLETIA